MGPPAGVNVLTRITHRDAGRGEFTPAGHALPDRRTEVGDPGPNGPGSAPFSEAPWELGTSDEEDVMSDVESARARAEALNEPAGRALRSARRSQMWAGLNRYLASEAAHARRTEEKETAAEAEEKDKDTDKGTGKAGPSGLDPE